MPPKADNSIPQILDGEILKIPFASGMASTSMPTRIILPPLKSISMVSMERASGVGEV